MAFAYNDLAEVYLKQFNYKKAKIYCGEAINYMADRSSYYNEMTMMWYNLATCYFFFENKPLETILYLRKVLSLLNEVEDEVLTHEIYIAACDWMAQQFIKVNQLDSAQVYVDKAQRVQKNYSYKISAIWTTQGQLWLEQNELRKAENALQKSARAIELEKGVHALETAATWLKLGRIYSSQEKYKQALTVLDRALWAA